MKKIGLLVIGLLVFGHAEFKRGDNNLTVIDTDTKLEWQDSYTNNNMVIRKLWKDAITYCEDLELDGKGWRLPNINELKSIVIETQYTPTINGSFKYTGDNTYYWSSTARKIDTDYMYTVSFYNGAISYRWRDSSNSCYVRCVRDAEN